MSAKKITPKLAVIAKPKFNKTTLLTERYVKSKLDSNNEANEARRPQLERNEVKDEICVGETVLENSTLLKYSKRVKIKTKTKKLSKKLILTVNAKNTLAPTNPNMDAKYQRLIVDVSSFIGKL